MRDRAVLVISSARRLGPVCLCVTVCKVNSVEVNQAHLYLCECVGLLAGYKSAESMYQSQLDYERFYSFHHYGIRSMRTDAQACGQS
jgi:hypothetical protein